MRGVKAFASLFLLPVLLSLAGTGCSVSEEDRDFFYTGWLNPNEPAQWKSGMTSNPGPASRSITDSSPQMDERR